MWWPHIRNPNSRNHEHQFFNDRYSFLNLTSFVSFWLNWIQIKQDVYRIFRQLWIPILFPIVISNRFQSFGLILKKFSLIFFPFQSRLHVCTDYLRGRVNASSLTQLNWAKLSSVKSKQTSVNLIGHSIRCLTNQIQDGEISFSVKNLRKPTVLTGSLIGSNWSRDQPKINISVRLTQYWFQFLIFQSVLFWNSFWRSFLSFYST